MQDCDGTAVAVYLAHESLETNMPQLYLAYLCAQACLMHQLGCI